jgi:hypothetical protein
MSYSQYRLVARVFLVSWAGNKAFNLLRPSSLEFKASFFLETQAILTLYKERRTGPNRVQLGPRIVWWDAMRGRAGHLSAANHYMHYGFQVLSGIEHSVVKIKLCLCAPKSQV